MIYFAQLPTGAIKIGFIDDVPTGLGQLETHYGAPAEHEACEAKRRGIKA